MGCNDMSGQLAKEYEKCADYLRTQDIVLIDDLLIGIMLGKSNNKPEGLLNKDYGFNRRLNNKLKV